LNFARSIWDHQRRALFSLQRVACFTPCVATSFVFGPCALCKAGPKKRVRSKLKSSLASSLLAESTGRYVAWYSHSCHWSVATCQKRPCEKMTVCMGLLMPCFFPTMFFRGTLEKFLTLVKMHASAHTSPSLNSCQLNSMRLDSVPRNLNN